MSGETELTAEQRVDAYAEELESYYKSLGLANPTYSSDIETILAMSYDDIRVLDKEECCYKAYILRQYAFYLQKEFNQHTAKLNRATDLLNNLIGYQSRSFDQFTKYEVKKALVLKENSFARVLNEVCGKLKMYVDSINGLSYRAEQMANTLENFKFLNRE